MMKHIRFLIFTRLLAFVLAVFDSNEIVDEVYKYRSITWEITENSFKEVTIVKIRDEPEKIKFNRENAYIVLKRAFEMTYRFHIHYLVSKYSLMSIKLKTVEYVIELRNALTAERNGKSLSGRDILLIREAYNQESYLFKDIFPQKRKNPRSISARRLYRISKVNGEVRFQQVPAQFSELNSSDYFVLVNLPRIIKFNVKVNEPDYDYDYSTTRNSIATFIEYETQYVTRNYEVYQHFCDDWVPGKKQSYGLLTDCYLQFLSKLEGCPEEKYIMNRIWENKVEEIPDAPDYQLYSPTDSGTTKIEREFVIENLETFNFTVKACYVFIMNKVKEVFIYIRDFKNNEQVEKCLKFGEEFAAMSEYLVSIFHKEFPATPFIFIFKKFRSLFLPPYMNWTRFIKMRNAMEAELP